MLSKANVTEFCCIVLKDEKGRKVEGGRDPQRKLMKQNQRKPLSNKSGLFIMQPSEKENKRGLGQEIELEVREEGIEISQCSLTKLLCPSKKKRSTTGTGVWDGQAYPRLDRESCWANNSRLVPSPDLQNQALLCLLYPRCHILYTHN